MDLRIYHGNITPADFARSLTANFNRGNLQVQQVGSGSRLAIQIASRQIPSSGGKTAISIDIQSVADGVSIQISKQAWMGVAASLGFTAMTALANPLNLLGRLDDIAQDIESLQLSDEVWRVIEATAHTQSANFELSEKLRRLVCEYCGSANQVGQSNCVACGAPLGSRQPITCKHCGYIVTTSETICPNCKQSL